MKALLGRLPAPLVGVLALGLLALNTLFWCLLLFALALVKLALPLRRVRLAIDPLLNAIATRWIACNSAWLRHMQATCWDVEGVAGLRHAGWYLVNCNHRSWVDILVLQHVLNGRVPLLKFFLKQQLLYVPVIGLAWWALDFPFMRRHSRATLRRHPELRGQDREATRRACEKFALVPTCVMNFAEGTRFTPAKQRAQSSPYRHLLKPEGGRTGAGAERDGRAVPLAPRRDPRLPRGHADLLAVRLRAGAAGDRARGRAPDPGAVLPRRLCRRRALSRRLPPLADGALEQKDRQIEALLRPAGAASAGA